MGDVIFVSLQGPVTVKVQVPNMQDKTEWKLNGQVLVFTLPLSDQVCSLLTWPLSLALLLWSISMLRVA